jgi:hypothetical protein
MNETARHRWMAVCAALALGACGQVDPVPPGELVINEIVSANDGAAVDEVGETDDYIELANSGDIPAQLDAFALRDENGLRVALPAFEVPVGGVVVLWADDAPEQGPLHLPFKISSSGDRVMLDLRGSIVDSITVPELAQNEAFMRAPNATGDFERCRFASPGRVNRERCEPAEPPEIDDDVEFAEFKWPEPWPPEPGPLVMSELALRPAQAIEVLNVSDENVTLDDFVVRLAPFAPGELWPASNAGAVLAWPEDIAELEPGERVVIEVPAAATSEIEETEAFEGVATIFEVERPRVIDRVEFIQWPENTALTRVPDASGRPRFCRELTLGEPNESCDELRSRPVGDRLHNLYTDGDFEALAQGDTSMTTLGVKFVVDLEAGNVVHFLSGERWALHYTFVRELIEHAAPLDRCDPVQASQFNTGWGAFSQKQYFTTIGRRFLLGTLEYYPGSDLWSLTYGPGDQINAQQMLQGFFSVMAHVKAPKRFAIRPSEPRQIELLQSVDGQAPAMGLNAPYRNVLFQSLTEGVGFGVLKLIRATELGDAALGRDVIVITDDVPNDIPLVGGLITEALQTPLAHVNILSKNRGTPNMALRDARHDAELEPLIDELVRLEVTAGGFTVRRATGDEADAFYAERMPTGPRIAPRLDTDVRGVQPLEDKTLDDLPAIGAKAAQLAELASLPTGGCAKALQTPATPFAIPVVHSLEHFEASGVLELLRDAEASAEFRADPAMRAAVLDEVRDKIMTTPVDEELLDAVTRAIDARFGGVRVRFRSSSNTEDLPAFNGAGLYTSLSAEVDDDDRSVDDAMRTVWASLFSLRAYDEREAAHIDQARVAMAILVHPAFLSERVNAVAISRNLLDPTRSDIHYFNVQRGEASVANPAPGVSTEQLTRRLRWVPGVLEIEYQSHSSFALGTEPVMTTEEVRAASCQLGKIHNHFKRLIDPGDDNHWFAVDIELKLLGDERELLIKQARPYSFGRAEVPQDCREF